MRPGFGFFSFLASAFSPVILAKQETKWDNNVTLNITHSRWDSADHFEALGFDDLEPNMVIRFDFDAQNGWQKWRHGSWLPLKLIDVPATVMVRFNTSKSQRGS